VQEVFSEPFPPPKEILPAAVSLEGYPTEVSEDSLARIQEKNADRHEKQIRRRFEEEAIPKGQNR